MVFMDEGPEFFSSRQIFISKLKYVFCSMIKAFTF